MLLQRRTAGATKKKKKKENNINRQEATTSNVHHLLAHSLLYHHYSFRNHAGLICFFFFLSLFLFPATFLQEAGKTSSSPLVASPPLTYCSVLHRLHSATRALNHHPITPHLRRHSLRQKSIVSVRSLLSPPQSHLFNLSSLSRVVFFFFFHAHRRERVS